MHKSLSGEAFWFRHIYSTISTFVLARVKSLHTAVFSKHDPHRAVVIFRVAAFSTLSCAVGTDSSRELGEHGPLYCLHVSGGLHQNAEKKDRQARYSGTAPVV